MDVFFLNPKLGVEIARTPSGWFCLLIFCKNLTSQKMLFVAAEWPETQ